MCRLHDLFFHAHNHEYKSNYDIESFVIFQMFAHLLFSTENTESANPWFIVQTRQYMDYANL